MGSFSTPSPCEMFPNATEFFFQFALFMTPLVNCHLLHGVACHFPAQIPGVKCYANCWLGVGNVRGKPRAIRLTANFGQCDSRTLVINKTVERLSALNP